MQQWEYLSVRSFAEDNIHLNDYGKEGWELTVVVIFAKQLIYFFKRPKLG